MIINCGTFKNFNRIVVNLLKLADYIDFMYVISENIAFTGMN